MSTIQASKVALRKEIHSKILELTKEEKRLQSEKVLQKLFSLPAFQSSQRISVFLSTDDEINTEPILRKIFDSNKKCYIPRYNGKIMEMVRLNSMKDWNELPLTKWNIKQPNLKEERENALETGGLDLLIVPGVAFTASGKRCGRGKGYYDSFLSTLLTSQKQRPATVGVSFKEQVLDDLPTHDHDFKLDYVLYAD